MACNIFSSNVLYTNLIWVETKTGTFSHPQHCSLRVRVCVCERESGVCDTQLTFSNSKYLPKKKTKRIEKTGNKKYREKNGKPFFTYSNYAHCQWNGMYLTIEQKQKQKKKPNGSKRLTLDRSQKIHNFKVQSLIFKFDDLFRNKNFFFSVLLSIFSFF